MIQTIAELIKGVPVFARDRDVMFDIYFVICLAVKWTAGLDLCATLEQGRVTTKLTGFPFSGL